MYGTIMRAKVQPGRREEFERMMRERVPDTSTGFHCAELAWEDKDPNRLVGVIHFRDRDSYVANATAPDTDKNYQQMVSYFESAPEWIDVHYSSFMGEPLSQQTLSATR